MRRGSRRRYRFIAIRFQADEDCNQRIIVGVLRREPALDIQISRAAGLLGLPDRDVLAVAARERRILISHDRDTMPSHFERFVREMTSPGLLVVSQKLAVRDAIEQILLVWSVSDAGEWRNCVGFLPF